MLEIALAVLLAAGPLPPVAQSDGTSLEALLERARSERAKLFERLRPRVDAAVKALGELETRYRKSERRVDPLREALVGLGPGATPLLVAHIDPGDGASSKERFVAKTVSEALLEMDTAAITTALLHVVSSGTPEGRRNAVQVLEGSPEPERVRPLLAGLFESTSDDALKQTCLRTLIQLGGSETDALLTKVLDGGDAGLIDLALYALADRRNAEAAPRVKKLLADAKRAEEHALALVAYFEAVPEEVDDEELRGFLAIASGKGSTEIRVAVLEAIAAFDPPLNSELRRRMEPLAASRDKDLREAALVTLARLGDKGSRKELLADYDEVVEKNENWSDAYARRAALYLRIGDNDDAIKDYKKALDVGKNDPTLQPGTYVGLARAYARKGKLKDAGEWLRKAPMSIAELQALADDPDFAELRDSRYGAEAFGQ